MGDKDKLLARQRWSGLAFLWISFFWLPVGLIGKAWLLEGGVGTAKEIRLPGWVHCVDPSANGALSNAVHIPRPDWTPLAFDAGMAGLAAIAAISFLVFLGASLKRWRG